MANEEHPRAKVFRAPPGWPPLPPGWEPPPGWKADTSWPAPPPGWRFWVPAVAETPPPPPPPPVPEEPALAQSIAVSADVNHVAAEQGGAPEEVHRSRRRARVSIAVAAALAILVVLVGGLAFHFHAGSQKAPLATSPTSVAEHCTSGEGFTYRAGACVTGSFSLQQRIGPFTTPGPWGISVKLSGAEPYCKLVAVAITAEASGQTTIKALSNGGTFTMPSGGTWLVSFGAPLAPQDCVETLTFS